MFTEDADVLKCGLFLKINRGPWTHDDSCCRAGFVLLWCVCSQDREDSSFFSLWHLSRAWVCWHMRCDIWFLKIEKGCQAVKQNCCLLLLAWWIVSAWVFVVNPLWYSSGDLLRQAGNHVHMNVGFQIWGPKQSGVVQISSESGYSLDPFIWQAFFHKW